MIAGAVVEPPLPSLPLHAETMTSAQPQAVDVSSLDVPQVRAICAVS